MVAASSISTVLRYLESSLEPDHRRDRRLDAVAVQREQYRAGEQPGAADTDLAADRAEQLVHGPWRDLEHDDTIRAVGPAVETCHLGGVANHTADHVARHGKFRRHRDIRARRVAEFLRWRPLDQ